MSLRIHVLTSLSVSVLLAIDASAQVTRADYERAMGLRDKYQYLTVNVPEPATWVEKTSRFYYRKSVKGGHEFVMVDAETRKKQPAFDHERLAAALAKETGETYTRLRLPFSEFTFVDGERIIELMAERVRWRCDLSKYTCTRTGPPAGFAGRRGLGGPVRDSEAIREDKPKKSPDGKWEAIVHNFNLGIRPAGAPNDKKLRMISADGSEGNYYDLGSVVWSPDSTRLAAYRVRPGYKRLVHYVESSPEDQLQPKHATFQYTKPGDALDLEQPVILQLSGTGQTGVSQIQVPNDLFPNPFDLTPIVWRKDGRAITFEYNQRGHQVYRVIEADAATGKARAIVSEEPKTFFYYNLANHSRAGGKRFRQDVGDGKEIVWMSERDG
jgi:hypothetical protein